MFYRKVYRFHQAMTERRTVAGIHVNVLAPKAFWTVIGVAVTLDSGTTMRTGEIFNVALEFFAQVKFSKIYLLVCYMRTASQIKENESGNLTNKETEFLKGLFLQFSARHEGCIDRRSSDQIRNIHAFIDSVSALAARAVANSR